MKHQLINKELQQRNHLGTTSEKLQGRGGGGTAERGAVKHHSAYYRISLSLPAKYCILGLD